MGEPEWRSWDWSRIAAYLKAERGLLSRREAAERAGIDEKTVYNLEQGVTPRRKFPETLEPYAKSYGWKPGSVRLVGIGQEPEVYEVPVPMALRPITRAERDARVAEALADTSLTNGQLRARLQALWDWPLENDGPSEPMPVRAEG